jgi:hypothetical protein
MQAGINGDIINEGVVFTIGDSSGDVIPQRAIAVIAVLVKSRQYEARSQLATDLIFQRMAELERLSIGFTLGPRLGAKLSTSEYGSAYLTSSFPVCVASTSSNKYTAGLLNPATRTMRFIGR